MGKKPPQKNKTMWKQDTHGNRTRGHPSPTPRTQRPSRMS